MIKKERVDSITIEFEETDDALDIKIMRTAIDSAWLSFTKANRKNVKEKKEDCVRDCGTCFHSTPEGQCEKALIIERPDGSMKTIYPGEEGYDKYRNIYG